MNTQTPSPDKTTQTQQREPLRWLAVAALLLAFLSICCVAQVVTYLLTPHDAHSALVLLSKNQADYRPWGDGPQLPPIAPQVPAAQAAERATEIVIAAQPTAGLAGLPTAELAIVPPAANAPTPTSASVLVFQPTPTSTPRLVAGGAPSSVPRTATALAATDTPPASDTPVRSTPTDFLTATPVPPTPQPTPAPTTGPRPTRVPTSAPVPTDTPAPTNTPVIPTDTPQPQPTSPPATNTPQPTRAPTRVPPRPTNTPVPTTAPTNTPMPTTAATSTPTDTPTTITSPPTDTPTDTPVATSTPTPTPGRVTVTKSVNPSSGKSPTNVTFTITVQNNTGGTISLTRIDDDMSSLTTFKGASCIGPDSNPCPVPPGRGGQWTWQGTVSMKDGDTATLRITGQFSYFPPIGPGTPTPAPTRYCNPRATATYTGGQASSGAACFTLQ